MPRLSFDSPLGRLTVFEQDGSITALVWGDKSAGPATPLLQSAERQLIAYFEKKRRDFDLPLVPEGTADEKRIWEAMAAIPYGETRSYGEIGRLLDIEPRAIGQACGRNKLPILLPCHRVTGADGKLVGYSGNGGIETKRKLLQLEGALLI
ncbi:MAG TPA: methylated-DNA--[protein]-cysteine S-methyltransferase [Stellaceae bacterium]|jgi:methylated-DNA-[protein]-cysteine S-methyltransferase|nr:methylated-DNA--[protein]-cysteine S-methyltransferase [Stellaceae bacterium]